MLRNACESLKPGGFFIGTIPNCALLVQVHTRYSRGRTRKEMGFESIFRSEMRKRPDKVFINDVCNAKMDDPGMLEDGIPLFGATYRFTLDEVVMDCPEYIIHFPLLE